MPLTCAGIEAQADGAGIADGRRPAGDGGDGQQAGQAAASVPGRVVGALQLPLERPLHDQGVVLGAQGYGEARDGDDHDTAVDARDVHLRGQGRFLRCGRESAHGIH